MSFHSDHLKLKTTTTNKTKPINPFMDGLHKHKIAVKIKT